MNTAHITTAIFLFNVVVVKMYFMEYVLIYPDLKGFEMIWARGESSDY